MSAGPDRPAASPERIPDPIPDRIVLTGFMGAGKSTVGRILAARLGWRFFDSDNLITAQHRLTVAEIFHQHGEARFREWETEAVREALRQAQCVLALGGGAIETPAVRELLFPAASATRTATLTIYLEAPLPELLARCAHPADGSSSSPSRMQARPLLAAAAEQTQARLLRRLPHYGRAHLTLATSGKTPEAVVEAVLSCIPSLRALAATHRSPGNSAITSASEAAS